MVLRIGLQVGKPEERLWLSKTTSISRSKWVSSLIRLLQLAAMVHPKQELQVVRIHHLRLYPQDFHQVIELRAQDKATE